MTAFKFFIDNLNRLPALPAEAEEHNLYAGLLELARQVAALQSELATARDEIRAIAKALPPR